MLLLFKYRLAEGVSDPAAVDQILFNAPREVIPNPDGKGGVKWLPVGKFGKTTIDVQGIKSRFEAFGIKVDWAAMAALQDERNHLEHAHPTKSVGAIAGFVADIFPILRRPGGP